MFLLGDERKKLPFLIFLFLASSMLDLLGIGLIGPYVALIVNPDSLDKGSFLKLFKFVGLPLEQQPLLIWIGCILVLIFFFKAVFSIFIHSKIAVFSNNQQVRLKSFLMQAYQNMPYKDYLKRNSAEYIQAIQMYTKSYGAVLDTGLKTVSNGLVGIAILAVLAWNNGLALGLLIFLLWAIVYGYDKLFRKNIRKYGQLANEAATKMVKGVHEGIEGLKEIRILGKENHFYQMVHTGAKESARYSIRTQIISVAPRYLIEFIMVFFVVTIVFFSLLMGNDLNSLTVTIGMFGFGALRLMPSANIISNSLITFRFNRHSISTVVADLHELKISNQEMEPQLSPLEIAEKLRCFSFRNVTFSYPNSNFSALNNISLEINASESIGLVGTSGSGKTTLVDVLLGLLEPQQGELCYNGNPLIESLAIWRHQVAYLPQQVFLIDDTLRRNVAIGVDDENIDDLQLNEAIRQARLIELVEQLPDGKNTFLGERGIRLSGGQRQRVALARAFYHKRNILIMDEATSSLDNETEEQIIEEIKYLKGKKTMIVIAHRQSTVQHCDRIYRLEHGRISEVGSPEEVL